MLLYILYKIAEALVLVTPLKASYWLASRIADIHYYTSNKDRTLILSNLRRIFGKIDSRAEVAARETVRNFGKYLVEFLRFSKRNEEYLKVHVKVEGIENLKEALGANKGVVIFSGHIGNWEWGAAVLSILGFPVNTIALAHKDPRVNNFFIKRRTAKGINNIGLGGSVRKSLDRLSRNEIVAILSDRDFSNNSVRVPFFGKEAPMPLGVGLFAVRARCPIVPAFMIRQKDDTHKLVIEKPLECSFTGKREEDVKNIVRKTTQTIERYARRYPEQWFMFDNPWKETGA